REHLRPARVHEPVWMPAHPVTDRRLIRRVVAHPRLEPRGWRIDLPAEGLHNLARGVSGLGSHPGIALETKLLSGHFGLHATLLDMAGDVFHLRIDPDLSQLGLRFLPLADGNLAQAAAIARDDTLGFGVTDADSFDAIFVSRNLGPVDFV